MIPREASVDELVEFLNSEDFDPVREINEAVDNGRSIQEQHPLSLDLMVRLNQYMQSLTESLQTSLEQLEKSGKRVPHEIDLLKNDVRSFNEHQSEKLPTVTDLANQSRRSAVLNQLATLNEVRNRIGTVQQLLQASQNPQSIPDSVRKQLAAVFANTPDASKWTGSTQNYYDLFNKMVKQQ